MRSEQKSKQKHEPTRRVDLNADLGESFGVYTLGSDDALLRSVTSANIACGFHAGDPGNMARTVAAAAAHGVALGAHPGLPDLAGFGRRQMAMTAAEVRDLTAYQIGALAAFAARHRQTLQHIKPHGALYQMAEQRAEIAEAIALAARDWDTKLVLVGSSGGRLIEAGRALGQPVAEELFADRAYLADGTLAPRTLPGAVLHNLEVITARITGWARQGTLAARDGSLLTLTADTLCLHSDTPESPKIAALVRQVLESEGITLKAMNAL